MNLFTKLFWLLLILKFSITLGETYSKEGKITGGYEAEPHSNPYIVSLQSRNLWRYYRICTGSILSERWILSSGHCVTDSFAKMLPMVAIIGAHNLARISESQIYEISQRIAHPMYRGGVGPHDISMMRTSRNIEFSEEVQPIRLPVTDPQFDRYEKLLITGWGAVQNNFFIKKIPRLLREAEVTYLPFYECYRAIDGIKDLWYKHNPLKKNVNLCTGPIYGDIAGCQGDSGAPLVQYVPTPMTTTTTMTTEGTSSPTAMTTDWPSTKSTITSMNSTTMQVDSTTTQVDSTLTTSESRIKLMYGITNRRKRNNLRSRMMPTVVGVLSWGIFPCGYKGAPTVYSNVTNYMYFIDYYLNR